MRPERSVAALGSHLGAGNGIRTRDTELGKLVLYQLSYARLTYSHSITDGSRVRPIYRRHNSLRRSASFFFTFR